MLTELALSGAVDIDRKATLRGTQVRVTSSAAPTDELLLGTWQRVERKPTDAYSLVLEIGPALRARRSSTGWWRAVRCSARRRPRAASSLALGCACPTGREARDGGADSARR
ncbi:hypothetical protein HQQ77_00150 [Frigoribacterium sp. VKM Ac-2860]|nr:hypothetical protein [Frigoribacterium sp. VKM Ac-2860]NQX07010.1 hypothetical protein [Frigoribacterium sp. VKM Ac-2859]